MNLNDFGSVTALPDYLIGYGAERDDGYGQPGNPAVPALGIRHPGLDGVWQATIPPGNGEFDRRNTGVGDRKDARKKLKALRSQLKNALKQFNKGKIGKACQRLDRAFGFTDGKGNPPDRVKGPARRLLARAIKRVRNRLGCES